MVLTVHIDNRNVGLCLFDGETLRLSSAIAVDLDATPDQYAIQMKLVMDFYGISLKEVEGAIVSSVVPNLLPVMRTAAEKLMDGPVIVVSSGIKTGLNMKQDNVSAIGADFICNCVGAMLEFSPPMVVIDFAAAATTFAAVDQTGAFIGRSILPGVEASLWALREKSAQLPAVYLDDKAKLFGKNTIDAVKSGILFGFTSMIEGLLSRYSEALDGVVTTVATGDVAEPILKQCRPKIYYRPHLLHQGLRYLYAKNCGDLTLSKK